MILSFICKLFGIPKLPSEWWGKALFALSDLSYITGIISILRVWMGHRQLLQKPTYLFAQAKSFSAMGDNHKSKHYFVKAGAYKEAAREAERMGQSDEAIKLAEMSGDYALSAELLSRNRLFDRAALMYESLGNLKEAGSAYEKAGNIEKALDCYQKSHQQDKVKRILRDMRRWEPLSHLLYDEFEALASRATTQNEISALENLGFETAQAFQHSKQYKQAANIYMRIQQYAHAGECYEQDGQLLSASELYKQAGQMARAADTLLRAKKFHQAAEVFEDMERPLEMAKVLEAAGEKTQARFVEAKVAVDRNETEKAGDLFLQAKKFDQAAAIFESQKRWKDAAQAWLKVPQLEKAAVSFERSGQLKEAAELYVQLSQFDRAAKVFQVAKMPVQASRAFQRAGDFYKAGQVLEENDPEAAITLYQQASHTDPQYWKIQHSLSRLFLSKGYKELSEKILSDLAKTLPYSKETLKVFYDHARFLEMAGKKEKALEVYDRMLAVQFDYKDVVLRRKKLCPS